MVTVAIKLHPSPKLKAAPKPARDKYVQSWLGTFAMKAPEFIAANIAANHPFQSRTGWAATKWKGEVTGTGKVRITSLVAYTYWLNYGIKPHQMTYLLNAKSSIPISTKSGLIFRRPSVASMSKGGWRHPGRAATHFLEQSLEALSKVMQQSYADLLVETLQFSGE